VYYTNRIELGRLLAKRMEHLKDSGAVVVALREEALPVCISMASQLRAWVFPLLTERINLPGDPRTLGVINQDGNFCWNPAFSSYEQQEFMNEFRGMIGDKKREAYSTLNRRTNEYGQLNKAALNGRYVLFVGDIIKDSIEVAAARELFKELRPQKIIGAGGNVDINAADVLHVATDETQFLDVMSNMFGEDHYFEQPDPYTAEQNRLLAMNIATYWV
jgi:putative phosphoribosyl transferase